MLAVLSIVYGVIGLGFGYWAARGIYHGESRDIPARSTGWALFCWIVFGSTWAVFVLLEVLAVIFDTKMWQRVGEFLFDKGEL